MKEYIQRKYFKFERSSQERAYYQQLQKENESLILPVHVKKFLPNEKIFCFKILKERNYEISGQEMEERQLESYLKFYFYSFVLFFPFNASYFTVHDESYWKLTSTSGRHTGGADNSMPSFLVNPLTNFLFSGNDEDEGNNNNDNNKSTSKKKKNSKASAPQSTYNYRSYLSETNFLFFLIQIILFYNEMIIVEIIEKKSFNEWGALLLYEEVLAYQKACEQFLLPYQEVLEERTSSKEEGGGITSIITEEKELSSSLQDYHWEYISSYKKSLNNLMNILKILTLDAPTDIRRYSYLLAKAVVPPSSSQGVSEKSGAGGKVVEDDENRFSEEEIRFYLSKRNDFSKEAIQKIKLTF
jgi:hypothetical protein